MNYFISALKKYAVFSGRAQRAEYWYFSLFYTLFSIVVAVISSLVGDSSGVLMLVFMLGMFIPGLAVAVRRMHDVGKSGWMLLVSIIPLIGFVWVFVLTVMDSTPGTNAYGPNPKGM